MYVDIIPNRTSPPAVLLREAYRKNGKSAKRTIGNISHLAMEDVLALKKFLGKKKEERREILFDGMKFKIERSLPHGHVKAVLGTLKKLGLDKMIYSRRCRERDIIVALIVERLIHPGSKLATTRTWGTSTLTEDLGLADVGLDEVYSALAWLSKRKSRIEKNLAAAHLSEGGMALYDLSSSSYYAKTCSLATFARGKKGRKKGIPCIAYGVMTDPDGRPVAVDIYPGNTGDPATVLDQAVKLQKRFGLSRVILVADHGTLTNSQIENLKKYPGIGWITAVKTSHLRSLVESGDHVTAHIFICMLAYYVELHLRQSLAPVLFIDEELETARRTRDPVKPAEASDSVRKKKIAKLSKDGFPLHSLSTLLTDLGTLCSNRCRMDEFAAADVTIHRFTEATPFQERVFQLLDLYTVT